MADRDPRVDPTTTRPAASRAPSSRLCLDQSPDRPVSRQGGPGTVLARRQFRARNRRRPRLRLAPGPLWRRRPHLLRPAERALGDRTSRRVDAAPRRHRALATAHHRVPLPPRPHDARHRRHGGEAAHGLRGGSRARAGDDRGSQRLGGRTGSRVAWRRPHQASRRSHRRSGSGPGTARGAGHGAEQSRRDRRRRRHRHDRAPAAAERTGASRRLRFRGSRFLHGHRRRRVRVRRRPSRRHRSGAAADPPHAAARRNPAGDPRTHHRRAPRRQRRIRGGAGDGRPGRHRPLDAGRDARLRPRPRAVDLGPAHGARRRLRVLADPRAPRALDRRLPSTGRSRSGPPAARSSSRSSISAFPAAGSRPSVPSS